MTDRHRTETGEFDDRIPATEVLEVFDALKDTARPLTAQDVADEAGMARRTAYNKLNTLVDQGILETRKVGARARVFWIPHVGSEGVADAIEYADDQSSTPEDERRDDAPANDLDGVPGTTDPTLEADDEFAQLVNDVADDALPGSGAKLEARREALHAVVEYLREHETATPADFRNDVYPAHNGQYTGGDDPARSWWKNAMYKGLKEIAERTDAVEKASTTGEWSYQSDRDE